MLYSVKQVRYSDEAVVQFADLLDNLETYYNIQTANRLERAVVSQLEMLFSLPFMYPEVETKTLDKVRKMTVLQKTIVLYRVEEKEIVILAVYDARMNWL